MEREACVCDHRLERSDLCAEIIIIVIIVSWHVQRIGRRTFGGCSENAKEVLPQDSRRRIRSTVEGIVAPASLRWCRSGAQAIA